MPRLTDLLSILDELDPEAVLYVGRPWSPASIAAVASYDDSPEGLSYFLEVELAQDVVEVWSAWRAGRRPDELERCRAVIYYAENDAYLPAETAPVDGR